MFERWMLEKIRPLQSSGLETDLKIKAVDTEQVLLTRGDAFFVVEGPDLFHVWEFDHAFSLETFYQVLGYLFVNAFRARKYATSSEARTWKPVNLMASCLVYQWKEEDVIDAPLPPPWQHDPTTPSQNPQSRLQSLPEETMQVLWRHRITDGLYVAWDPLGLGKVTVILPEQVQTLQEYLHRTFPDLDERELQRRRKSLLDERFYEEERIFTESWVPLFLQVVQESLFLSELDLVKLTYLGYVAVAKAREDGRYTELAATFLSLCSQLDVEVVKMVASKVQAQVDFTPLLDNFLRSSDKDKVIEILVQQLGPEKAFELFSQQLGPEKAFELFSQQLGPEKAFELFSQQLDPEKAFELFSQQLDPEKAFELFSQQLGPEKTLRILISRIGKQRTLKLLEHFFEEDG